MDQMLPASAELKEFKGSSPLLTELSSILADGSGERALKGSVQLLRNSSDHYDWVGIYLVRDQTLELAAYAGDGETEHVRIPIGQGICGLAAKENSTIVVPDVSKDPRYLMCFASTRSEIVVPIKGKSRVLGEIDIDSDTLSAFTDSDRETLEEAAKMLANYIEKFSSN
jgi:L-methionine (R)-S-oxide reductase